MVKIINLNKSFNKKDLFKDFSLDIDSNEFVIIQGKSGCGKTTLLNMIGGLESTTSGNIIIDDLDITKKKNMLPYYRTKVGFLFQNFVLIEDKTVKQNLEIVSKKYRSNTSIEDALKMVGLEDKINEKIFHLSGGEQQRIALARLMVKKCDLILADEPTGSLDSENAMRVVEILKKIHESGKTVIMVTHDDNLKSIGTKYIDLKQIAI